MRELALSAAQSIHPSATIHDLQVESSAAGREVFFDIIIPFGLDISDDEAREKAEKFMADNGGQAHINIDHPFIEH